jgi:septal ring factor EnvC (AmiA/AmiB activator)
MEDSQYQEEMSEAGNQSMGIDQALDHLKNTLHEMKLQDAIHRQNIRKLEKTNDKMEQKIGELKSNIEGLEKQKSTDEQYLMKQQEIIVKLEMAEEIEKASAPSQGTKTSKTALTGMQIENFYSHHPLVFVKC